MNNTKPYIIVTKFNNNKNTFTTNAESGDEALKNLILHSQDFEDMLNNIDTFEISISVTKFKPIKRDKK